MAQTVTTSDKLMDGKAVSARILEECGRRVSAIVQRTGVTPCLATVLVGADPASATYVKMKQKKCAQVGMKSLSVEMAAETTTDQLVSTITGLSEDPSVHGILLQHPVPPQIDERAAFEAISPDKDVDGVTATGLGRMWLGISRFGSCTPAGIMRLMAEYDVSIKGKNAVVIGRSPILGKPMAAMLCEGHATVTICHSRTQNIGQIVQQADIIVAAVGKAKFVKGDWVKEGAVVLDAGYNVGNIGDVDFEAALPRASLITPVPGGVGPMTIATLIDQTADAADALLG